MTISCKTFPSARDADFVDAIHTDATLYGSYAPVGHVDFYPGNAGRYGRQQPQYDLVDDIMGWSHNHAMTLFAISVNNRFGSSVIRIMSSSINLFTFSCNAWKKCTDVASVECEYLDSTSQPRMGYHLDQATPHGQYSLVAYKEYPFCK